MMAVIKPVLVIMLPIIPNTVVNNLTIMSILSVCPAVPSSQSNGWTNDYNVFQNYIGGNQEGFYHKSEKV